MFRGCPGESTDNPAPGVSPRAAGEFDESYTRYQLRRSYFRKIVRRLYLRNVLKHCRGRTVDFGCGVGELLARLPPGSVGLEVNPATVKYCRGFGLNVEYYDPTGDGYQFEDLPAGAYTTFVMSHVLEHLKDPDQVLRSILHSCERLGISSVIMIVPGAKGFAFDHTHKTFIDEVYLSAHNLWDVPPWTVSWKEYFPFNAPWVGRYFTYHELLFIYEKRS